MLEINIEGNSDFSMCRPSGDFDAYTVDEFRDALSSLATVSKLLIDLSDVPFMDSAGLGALIGSIRKAGENNGQIVVSCERESLLGLLKTTGFDQIVTVTESVKDFAYKSFLIGSTYFELFALVYATTPRARKSRFTKSWLCRSI